ncbi:DUF2474 domain-containing protein [Mangrovicella endophytica]|nr:DUF2474 domain-containing protein [Mangrovicella endophytica]
MKADEAPGPLWKRLAWFVALWIGGVAVVGATGFVIRLMIMP